MPQLTGNEPASPTRLGALELDLAPDLPGIYAWYAQLALSADDWRPRMCGGIDIAGADLINAIEDYARIHEAAPVELKGAATYGLNWFGSIQRQSVTRQDTDSGESLIHSRLDELASTADNRRLLTHLLRSAPPVFASPLYIGVATNLRQRLAEHRASFEKANTLLRSQPDQASNLQFLGRDLGARLAGAGIPLERLECWILTAPELPPVAPEPATNHRPVAQAAEWIVQRIFQPILGRQ
ncbi:hypothetical protein HGK72_25750 [Mycolicibacterium fortuitum]|uniref:hypothetical protein n=1 Tax=Mycolicibacterium fortuitum TaxID=1766 RepID=UPI0014901D44|nr:hypothetical protein [Mycolicibacterium fortuitum]